MKEELRAASEFPPLLVAPLGWAASLLPCTPIPSRPSTAFYGTHGVYDCCKEWRCKRETLKLQSTLPGLDHPGLSPLPLTPWYKCRGSPFSSNYAKFHISPLTYEYLSMWEFPRNYTWLPKHKYGHSWALVLPSASTCTGCTCIDCICTDWHKQLTIPHGNSLPRLLRFCCYWQTPGLISLCIKAMSKLKFSFLWDGKLQFLGVISVYQTFSCCLIPSFSKTWL